MSRNRLILTLIILILGVSFRLAHLGDKIFWVDEVATITRVSGYTRSQILTETQKKDLIYPSDLLKYQKLNPEQTFSDTLKALVQSPEHAPLYFILARFWLQLFGDSLVTIRSFSVIFGVLCLPSIYFLSLELFNSKIASNIALLCLTVSPFYVAYSQEARPYSLWTFLILINSILLFKSIKSNSNNYWCGYLFSTVLSIYTSLFSWLILLAQGYYLSLVYYQKNSALLKYFLVTIASIITFIPWFWVIINHWYQLQDNTSWMNEPMQLSAMIAVWVASILLIFGNLPLSPELDIVVVVGILIFLIFLLLVILGIYSLNKKSYIINYKILSYLVVINIILIFSLIRLFAKHLPLTAILNPIPIIGITTAFGLLFLVLYSCFFIYYRASKAIKYFVLSLFLTPTLILILSDLLLQDQRSATPRYLIPAQLAIILMVTYLLSKKINHSSKIAQLTLNGLLILAVISCSLTWQDSPQFQKSRNYHNPAIENIINQQENPLIISDSAQIMDLLSMSHNLKPQVMIKLFSSTTQIASQNFSQFATQDIFIFNPNQKLIQNLKELDNILVKEVYKPHLRIPGEIYLSLWLVQLK